MSESRRLNFYGYVDRPYELVRRLLRSRAEDVFQRATNAASERTGGVVARLHVGAAGIDVGVDVKVVVQSRPDDAPQGGLPPITHFSVSWRAASAAAIFPSLSADLSLSPMNFGQTRVELVGTYTPPLGPAGRAFDAAVGHTVAEAAVHNFVDDLLGEIRNELPMSDGGSPGKEHSP